jgi:hypothetical protein
MDMFAETASLIIIYHLPTKGNKLPFYRFRLQETNGRLPFSSSVLQQTNESCGFPLVPFFVYKSAKV